ncbi:MAG: AAA family ATPase [Calditrichia bacterium]
MIPLSLTLRGMYSYRSDQTIDFTKLTESQLFGIFGPSAAAKSTDSEAITYVLYGKIERSRQMTFRLQPEKPGFGRPAYRV